MARVCDACGEWFSRECGTCRDACRHEVDAKFVPLLEAVRGLGVVELYDHGLGDNPASPGHVARSAYFRPTGGEWHDLSLAWEPEHAIKYRARYVMTDRILLMSAANFATAHLPRRERYLLGLVNVERMRRHAPAWLAKLASAPPYAQEVLDDIRQSVEAMPALPADHPYHAVEKAIEDLCREDR